MHNKYFKMKKYSNIFPPRERYIEKVVKLLRLGKVGALPTETVYGLAGNAYSNVAVRKIYQLKKRPKKNPLIVHFYNLEAIQKETEFNPYLKILYKKFSPGPITYVLKLKKKSKISKLVLNENKTIACRVPSHFLFRKVLKKLNFPLAAPSANLSTKVSPTSALDVFDEFKHNIPFILDGKKTSIGLESSVINLVGKPKLLRPGMITEQELQKVLKKKISKEKTKKILSPGQMKKHYSPGIPVYLNQKLPKKNGAILLFGKSKYLGKNKFYLSKSKSLKEAARNLYSLMRKMKHLGYKSISVNSIPNQGIGIALNDRLKRASQ